MAKCCAELKSAAGAMQLLAEKYGQRETGDELIPILIKQPDHIWPTHNLDQFNAKVWRERIRCEICTVAYSPSQAADIYFTYHIHTYSPS